ncbi:TPA: hypothetical protein I8287_005323 [Kluyvera intermedia]|nr:hypothetical protein [Kluyvera intermedia]
MAKIEYNLTRGSDVIRDGMYLELSEAGASLWKRLKNSFMKQKNCFRQQSRNHDGPERLLSARNGHCKHPSRGKSLLPMTCPGIG